MWGISIGSGVRRCYVADCRLRVGLCVWPFSGIRAVFGLYWMDVNAGIACGSCRIADLREGGKV